MDEITLKNFRCFREEQTARLAPLTLLVGENSTGKTSFMAMIRGLWDVAYGRQAPDFKKAPYDLGSFDEIAHYRGGRGGRAETFEAGFKVSPRSVRGKRRHTTPNAQPYLFEMAFKKKGTVPIPVKMRLSNQDAWVESLLEDQSWQISFGTSRGVGVWKSPDVLRDRLDADLDPNYPIWLFDYYLRNRKMVGNQENETAPITFQGSELLTDKDWELINQLVRIHRQRNFEYHRQHRQHRGQPYASAPVRSKPRRTYDPARWSPDSEGEYVPMYLADLYFQDQGRWTKMKDALESFGQVAGLFDEISIKPLGRRSSEPFQVQVRKFDGGLKGPQRNLIDVGYGVSQMLPVITELLRHNAPPMFLLQQPEVHLHPSAQAALGSLFCQVADPGQQLIIETHSDHLLDRVRMDVRDGTTSLKPDDVSILFFERGDLDVHIHSLRIDEEGNILNAPDGYRQFFMEETARSLWKRPSIGT